MQETLMWALMLLAEASLLSSGVLGFLLWRARKLQRRLRAELAEIQRSLSPLLPQSLMLHWLSQSRHGPTPPNSAR